MSPRERKFFLALLGFRHSELVEQIGCTKSELSQCLSGKRQYPEIRKKLVTLVRQRVAEKQLFGNEVVETGLRSIRSSAPA